MLGIKEKYEKHHNVNIDDEVIDEIVNLSARYISDRYMPDKAIDLLDEASSKVRMKAFTIPDELKDMEKEINKISIFDRIEETKESKQYNKNCSYLNKNYSNNAYIIMKFLKDLKIDIYNVDIETLINKGGLK